MDHYLLLLIGTVFVNNIVMSKILGLCPFMGVSKKIETSISMGLATTFVLTLASGASYLINEYLLGTELFYLRTLSFIVVIAGIVQFTEMFIHKTSPVLYQVLGIYLPLITTNCAVLGIPLLNAQAQHNFVESLIFGAGGALGFTLVMVLFAGVRERMEAADVPKIFQGTSIAMITAGLMSLAFMGFSRPGKNLMWPPFSSWRASPSWWVQYSDSPLRFKVEGDPLVEKIDAILPQTQCGQCGFPGCKPYATAIAKGEADINKCPPGGEEGVKKAGRAVGRRSQAAGCRTQSPSPSPLLMKTCASAARSASRPVRWMPYLARPNRCTPSSPPNARVASSVSRPAR